MQQLETAEISSLPAPPRPDLARLSLFLDFDGTLSEIAPTPDAANLFHGIEPLLAALLAELDGRVAILSGRDLPTLDRLVPVPGLSLAGVHGLERRTADGRLFRPDPPAALTGARARLQEFIRTEPRLILEDKGLSLALHYRAIPGLAAIAHKRMHDLADQFGLALQTGKMVIELRSPGADKGVALSAIMADTPFAGSTPWMLGDDDTDESAFRAAIGLGGGAVRVGPPTPATAARHGLPDVASVRTWLEGILA